MSFDFDYWKDLAEKDPEQFEVEAWSFIDSELVKLTGGATPTDKEMKRRAKIRGTLWKRHIEYRKLAQPERFNRLVAHFWEDVKQFQEAINASSNSR